MICATKSIKATPAACYALFKDAKSLDRWLGPKHEYALAEGASLANGDGNRATVKKVSPDKMIKLDWTQAEAAPNTSVELKFKPAGAKTTVMVQHDRLQPRADADGMRRACGEALDRLKSVVEG